MNNVIKRIFETFNYLIFTQFIQSHNVFLNNIFDENSNQFDFVIDLIEEIQKEIQIFDAIIMIFENV